jgi:hypothetical protein
MTYFWQKKRLCRFIFATEDKYVFYALLAVELSVYIVPFLIVTVCHAGQAIQPYLSRPILGFVIFLYFLLVMSLSRIRSPS